MADEHTPEPWKLDPDVAVLYQKHQVCVRDGKPWVQLSVEDFERAAACVNACKGIPLTTLESASEGMLAYGLELIDT